jgi:hypothetical protein
MQKKWFAKGIIDNSSQADIQYQIYFGTEFEQIYFGQVPTVRWCQVRPMY